MEEEPPTFSSLPKPALEIIAEGLALDSNPNPRDLVAFSAVNTATREAARVSGAWKALSQRRWGPAALQTHLFTDPDGTTTCDYKRLFAQNNGWDLAPHRFPAPWSGWSKPYSITLSHVAALTCATHENNPGEIKSVDYLRNNVLTFTTYSHFDGPMLAKSTEPEHVYGRTVIVPTDDEIPNNDVICIECIDFEQGIAAVGKLHGSVDFLRLPKEEDDDNTPPTVNPASRPPPAQQYPVTCLKYHPGSSRLFALYDRGECGEWRPHDNGIVLVYDSATQQVVADFHEVLNYQELCTILPLDVSGNVVVGGAVKICQSRWENGFCPRCDPTAPASLCWHQNRSSNAALAFFDLRAGEAPGRMVGRIALPHRSLYPRIEKTEMDENYLLLSHAGNSLAIWDQRNLQQGPLACPNLNLDARPRNKSQTPHGAKKKRKSNSLFLSTHGSMLAGRADNGCIGIWDLTKILNWRCETVPLQYNFESFKDTVFDPVLSYFVWPADSDEVSKPRCEVWIGSDWFLAPGPTSTPFCYHQTPPYICWYDSM